MSCCKYFIETGGKAACQNYPYRADCPDEEEEYCLEEGEEGYIRRQEWVREVEEERERLLRDEQEEDKRKI